MQDRNQGCNTHAINLQKYRQCKRTNGRFSSINEISFDKMQPRCSPDRPDPPSIKYSAESNKENFGSTDRLNRTATTRGFTKSSNCKGSQGSIHKVKISCISAVLQQVDKAFIEAYTCQKTASTGLTKLGSPKSYSERRTKENMKSLQNVQQSLVEIVSQEFSYWKQKVLEYHEDQKNKLASLQEVAHECQNRLRNVKNKLLELKTDDLSSQEVYRRLEEAKAQASLTNLELEGKKSLVCINPNFENIKEVSQSTLKQTFTQVLTGLGLSTIEQPLCLIATDKTIENSPVNEKASFEGLNSGALVSRVSSLDSAKVDAKKGMAGRLREILTKVSVEKGNSADQTVFTPMSCGNPKLVFSTRYHNLEET